MIKFLLKKILNPIKSKDKKNRNKFLSKLLNKNKIRLLDIGAAGGIHEIWAPYQNNIDLMLFEPHLDSFNTLEKKNDKTINKGFWSEKKVKQSFFQTKKPECSGLLQPNIKYLRKFPNPERFEIIKTTNIETTTLDDEFDKTNYPHFIKIDTEGAELPILKGGENSLNYVFGLLIECYFFEFHKNQYKFEEVKNYLEKKNIQFLDFLNMIRWERHNHRFFGQPQASDVLFIVPPEIIIEKYNSKKINLDDLKIYVSILFIFNRSDLIEVLIKLLNTEEKSHLFLDKAYHLTEKKVKQASFIRKIKRYYFDNFF